MIAGRRPRGGNRSAHISPCAIRNPLPGLDMVALSADRTPSQLHTPGWGNGQTGDANLFQRRIGHSQIVQVKPV